MTNGQVRQLQDLSKCSNLRRFDKAFVASWLEPFDWGMQVIKMGEFEKAWLRRLTHQYRNQIAAIKRNGAK